MTSKFKQRHSFFSIKRFIFLLAAVLICSGQVWATDYVIKYDTHYMCVTTAGSLSYTDTFDPNTCVWTAASSSSTSNQTSLESDESNYLYIIVNGTTYWLQANLLGTSDSRPLSVQTTADHKWRSDGTNIWCVITGVTKYYLVFNTNKNEWQSRSDDKTQYKKTTIYTVSNSKTDANTSYSITTPTITPSSVTLSSVGATETLTASVAEATKTITPAYYTSTFNDGTAHTFYRLYDSPYTRSSDIPVTSSTDIDVSYSWSSTGLTGADTKSTTANPENWTVTYTTANTSDDVTGTVTVTATAVDGSTVTSTTATATASVTLKKMPVFYYSASAGVGTGLSAGGGTVSATAKTGTLDSEKYKIIGTTSDATSVDATVEFKVESTTEHFVFDHWSTMEDGSDNVSTNTTYSCTVSVDNSHSTALSALAINRYAIFKPVSKLTVEVWPHDYGYVYSNESKSATPGWTQNTHTTTIDNTDIETGTSYKVYMFAKPDASHKFKGWSTTKTGTIEYPIDDQTGATSQEISINNTTDVTMYARFVNIYKFEASAKAALKSGDTEVESTVGGTVTATIGTETEHGTESTKTIETSEAQASAYTWYEATPNTNYVFDHWTTKLGGTALSGANPYNKITTNTVSGSTVYYNSSSTPVTLYAVFKSLNNPTSWTVAPDKMTLYMKGTKTGTITVTLSPEGCDRDLEFVSANPNVATVSDEGVVTGVAHGTTTITVNAYIRNTSSERVVGFTQDISVTVEDQIPTPVITWAESTTDASKATITITTGDGTPDEAKIYYTTDGTDPTSSSTEYTGTFDVGDNTTIKAIAITPTADGWRDSEIATLALVLKEAETPVITFSKNSAGKVEVTITSPDEGVTIYYTTDGTDPKTSSTKQTYTSPFVPTLSGTDNNTTTIKAYAVHPGWKESKVATADYIAGSGIYGTSVILNDLEDHNWTYYKGVDTTVDGGNYNTNYKGKMYSPDPRNVKITYEGNGGAISFEEAQTSMVYYTTLEKSGSQYPYTTIHNPFSKRPTGKGFIGWKVVSISDGCSIDGYAVNSTIPAETEIKININSSYTTNCISTKIELDAVWDNAYIQHGSANNLSTMLSNISSGTYETNIIVITSGSTSVPAVSKNVTITMVEPDGVEYSSSIDHRSSSCYLTHSSDITLGADVKFEYCNINVSSGSGSSSGGSSSRYLYIGNGHNVTLGRGLKTTSGSYNFYNVWGTSGATSGLSYKLKVESGTYYTLSFTSGTFDNTNGTDNNTVTISGTVNVKATIGCDYDRATTNNNSLTVYHEMHVGGGPKLSGVTSDDTFAHIIFKSGKYITDTSASTSNSSDLYMGMCIVHNAGRRDILIEGGYFNHNVTGGMDNKNDNTKEAYHLRMKGGTIVGSLWGAAEWADAKGHRTFVITGGSIGGWLGGGCNGTQTTNGQTDGDSFIYVGGNASINSNNSSTKIGYSEGGVVFGAGSGHSDATSESATVGKMNNSNIVIADSAYVEKNIYGGGNYGQTLNLATIYITGGTIDGKVFGGSNQQRGTYTKIITTGGLVKGGIYGGSNISGIVHNDVEMLIYGGQVGTSTTAANVHGGGYGSSTVVSGNVDVTLGTRTGSSNFSYTTSGSAVIYGDVYGGSALGKTNGTSANTTYHTNVTLNGGTIHGSLYGGALGDASTAAYVYAPVTVKVYGGSVKKTSAAGSGGVYGANNINGAPQRSVTVDIWGTDPATSADEYALYAVYGGGNKSAYKYTGYPIVTVHNCDNSIEYVYGGGNAADVSSTDVTIWGGNVIGNVFGGGNGSGADNPGANVDGKAAVKINGGTIISVYGGSNEKGTIGGGTSVVVNQQKEEGASDVCYMLADSVFGGGNKAAYTGNTDVQILNGQVKNVFGGANKAVVTGNTSVKIGDTDTSHKVTILGNVFGGGNEADVSGNTVLTVEDCNTSIAGDVYGGGNLADVTNANVAIYGGTIGNVFGGGRGSLEPTPSGTGADVNGNATTNVYGGQFGGIFGAGNIKSNISGTAKLYVSDETYSDHACCDFGGADEIYGAGNKAEIDGSIDFSLGCIKNKIEELYGGAKDANLGTTEKHCNINLNIISGTFGKIFGGNNLGGTITGTITVNVDETGCDSIVIDELYGGGNLAAYAGNPTLNVKSCTRIGKIFGGGLGNGATVTGNPAVNVELGKGLYSADHKSRTGYEIGIIGTVFGGGNEANVTGNTAVKIATKDGKDAVITGNVYGGGNNASVTGSTDVQIGKKK